MVSLQIDLADRLTSNRGRRRSRPVSPCHRQPPSQPENASRCLDDDATTARTPPDVNGSATCNGYPGDYSRCNGSLTDGLDICDASTIKREDGTNVPATPATPTGAIDDANKANATNSADLPPVTTATVTSSTACQPNSSTTPVGMISTSASSPFSLDDSLMSASETLLDMKQSQFSPVAASKPKANSAVSSDAISDRLCAELSPEEDKEDFVLLQSL